jgi:hypothetical protein
MRLPIPAAGTSPQQVRVFDLVGFAGGISIPWLQCVPFSRQRHPILNPKPTSRGSISPFEPCLPCPDRPLIHWQQLYGSSLGLAIVQAATQLGVVIVVTTDTRSAQRVEDQIRFYSSVSKPIPVFTFLDWECLPYDSFSPHPDIVSQRLRTLSQLPSLTAGIIIIAASILPQRLAPLEYIGGHCWTLFQYTGRGESGH